MVYISIHHYPSSSIISSTNPWRCSEQARGAVHKIVAPSRVDVSLHEPGASVPSVPLVCHGWNGLSQRARSGGQRAQAEFATCAVRHMAPVVTHVYVYQWSKHGLSRLIPPKKKNNLRYLKSKSTSKSNLVYLSMSLWRDIYIYIQPHLDLHSCILWLTLCDTCAYI
jgi:hypothetical protein